MKIRHFIKNNMLIAAVAAVLTAAIAAPLITVFIQAVTEDGQLYIAGMLQVVFDPENISTILNSLKLGAAVVVVSTIIAAPCAYLLARTQFARYKWLDIVLMIPFMTPPYIASMGWILFMQKNGLFQQLFPCTGTFSEAFFSFTGLTLVMSFHVFPFMLTILKNAFLNISSSLEESGAVFGGNFFYRMRRIMLPLLSGNYAIGALLVFVKTLSEYGTPATLGKRIGFYVFTTDINRYATTSPVDFGKAASLSSALIGICLFFWFIQNYITNRRSYKTVSGKGVRLQLKKYTGLKRFAAWFWIVLIIVITIGIPYFSVGVTSFIKLRGYGLASGNFTFQHYIDLFAGRKGRSALFTSLYLSTAAATISAVFGTLVVTAVKRCKKQGGKVIEACSLLPEMLPNIVLVIGLMLFWNKLYHVVKVYNTIWMMILTYVVLFLPYTIQYVTSSFSQINPSLLMAGRSFGGSSHYVFFKISLPLIFKGIMTGWTMTFIITFRELVASAMIAPPNTLTVSTYIVKEFEQGSVSIGMAMAVVCVLFTTGALIMVNRFVDKERQ